MRCPACDHDNIPGQDLCESCGLDLAGLDVQAWGVSPQDPLISTPLADLPLKEALLLGPQETVADAIELMKQRHEGCVFVVGDGGLEGVFTERDLAVRVAARGRDPAGARLAEVMTPRPFTLEKEDPLALALHRMGVDGYRHLPIMEGKKVAGFLSMRTVLQVLAGA